jgi:hypothetical protein
MQVLKMPVFNRRMLFRVTIRIPRLFMRAATLLTLTWGEAAWLTRVLKDDGCRAAMPRRRNLIKAAGESVQAALQTRRALERVPARSHDINTRRGGNDSADLGFACMAAKP